MAAPVAVAATRHSTGAAVLWSLFGLGWGGAIYNRQYTKAMLMLGLSAVFALGTLGLSLLLTWPVGILDAAIAGGKLEAGETISEWTPLGEISAVIGMIFLAILYVVLRLDRTQPVHGYWRNGRYVRGYWRRPPS